MCRIHALSYFSFFLLCFVNWSECTVLGEQAGEIPSIFHEKSGPYNFTWSFDKDNQSFFEELQSSPPTVLVLEAVTHEVDCVIARQELIDVLGFDHQSVVTREQLCSALRRLVYKNKFEKIEVTLCPFRNGWSLHIGLRACWTLSKVRCKGNIVGKDRYRHRYSVPIGNRFDPLKHHEGMRAIESVLHDEGYLEGNVTDMLAYDEVSKTVAVTLLLDPGACYAVRSIAVELMDHSVATNALAVKLKRLLLRQLHGAYVSKQILAEAVHHIEELCVKEGFLHVQVTYEIVPYRTRHEVQLIFKIAPGERRRFSFFGNHFFSERALHERLLLFGKSISLVPASLLGEELVDFYKDNGFWSMNIAVQEEQDRSLFCITEGPRVRVKGVRYEGVRQIAYADFCTLCAPLLSAAYFDKKKQRMVRENIIQAYVCQGFWDCEIVSEQFVPIGNDMQDYEYHVVIREGLQRTLRSVVVPGFEESLKSTVVGIPFDIRMVQEQRRALLEYLQSHGYVYANPKPVLNHTLEGDVDVVWQVDNAIAVHVGGIIVAGATRLPSQVVVQELDFMQGELWDHKKLQTSVAKLKRLGIFEDVYIRPIDTEAREVRDVVITCIDDDPFEIRARAGMQCIGQYLHMNDIGARYGGSLIWKNPTNRADRLQVALDISPHIRYGDLTYRMPHFFSYPLTTIYSLYSSRFDEGLMNCFKSRLYRLTQDGCSCEWEYAIDQKKWGLCVGFESMKVACLSQELARLIDFAPRLIDERVPYWYVEPVVMIAKLDDPVSPTSGTVTILSAKAMVPVQGRDSGFVKIIAEESLFFPLFKNVVGAFHLRAGHIFYTVFSRIMPSERFYLGGAYSLRGYDTDVAPPVTICGDRLSSTCLVPIGGKTVLSAMCEARFPLYKALGGVFFTDFGILVRDAWKEDDVVGASGFGVRYATPVGALRFDIAWKWNKQVGEKHGFAWFLTLGQAF